MIQRLLSRSNPNLLLLQYDAESWSVRNVTAIPKYYFTPCAYPHNGHIKEKLRQQLQVLRDQQYLKFVDKGVYELAS